MSRNHLVEPQEKIFGEPLACLDSPRPMDSLRCLDHMSGVKTICLECTCTGISQMYIERIHVEKDEEPAKK